MKPILLASQSNSGSTWFADCIAKSSPHLKYFRKEFFNPILNHGHHATLAESLGCELFSCVKNLALHLTQDRVDWIIDETWDTEGYTFTKENYLVWNLAKFARRFRVVGLVRPLDFCFPPERISVLHWYDNWFWSLVNNRRFPQDAMPFLLRHARTAHRRAVVGWLVVHERLLASLAAISAPTVSYNALMCFGREQLLDLFDLWPADIDRERLVEEIISTRRPMPQPAPARFKEWEDALEFGDEFMTIFGPSMQEHNEL